jgi:transcriptional regulator with XRE-family HTH domain
MKDLLVGGEFAPANAKFGLLHENGLSVEQFARKIGLTRTMVYYYIAGKSAPTAKTLRLICEVLDIPFEEGLRYCKPVESGRQVQTRISLNKG